MVWGTLTHSYNCLFSEDGRWWVFFSACSVMCSVIWVGLTLHLFTSLVKSANSQQLWKHTNRSSTVVVEVYMACSFTSSWVAWCMFLGVWGQRCKARMFMSIQQHCLCERVWIKEKTFIPLVGSVCVWGKCVYDLIMASCCHACHILWRVVIIVVFFPRFTLLLMTFGIFFQKKKITQYFPHLCLCSLFQNGSVLCILVVIASYVCNCIFMV